MVYALSTEPRKKVVTALLDYPRRLWSCPALEDVTKLSHATVFRTVKELQRYGLLRSTKINRRDVAYEFIRNSLLVKEIKKVLRLEQHNSQAIAREFSKAIFRKVGSSYIQAIILYGSTVKGTLQPESDIDVLIIIRKKQEERERKIYDLGAALSLKYNKTISPLIMDTGEVRDEKKQPFLRSVKESMEVLYGKASF